MDPQVKVLGEQLGNYRVVEKLGEGGMGVVYVGRHETLGHRVVVKVLRAEMSRSTEMVRRFFNEAQAATAIRHPGIVQVFDFGTTSKGAAYFVMELLDGQDLGHRLKARPLEVVESCRIARQVANVLQSAHDAGITHRDLKPDNLFLVPDPEVIGGERVKVLDFGIAKLAGELHKAGVQTRMDVVMGTPSYMAPEQCRGAAGADNRSDIYALGCILFKMVSGRAPFIGHGPGDIIGAHLHVPAPDLQQYAPHAPAPLAALVAKMRAKSQGERPQTMAAVSQALEEILRTLTDAPARASGPLPMLPPARPSAPLPGLPPVAPPHGRDSRPPPRPSAPLPGLPVAPGHGRDAEPPPRPSAPAMPPPAPMVTAPSSSLATTMPVRPPADAPSPAYAATQPAYAPQSPAYVGSPPPAPQLATPPMATPPSGANLPHTSQTTLGGAAGVTGVTDHGGRRRLPFVLGGLVTAVAVAAIAIVLATGGSESSPTPAAGGQVSFDDIKVKTGGGAGSGSGSAVEPGAGSETGSAVEPGAGSGTGSAAAGVDDTIEIENPAPAANTGSTEAPAVPASALETECRSIQDDRKWDALAQCAARLKPANPQLAAELEARAAEEAKLAPRIAAFEAALRNKDLRQARTEFDLIPATSLEHPRIKKLYLFAEHQAITELAAELARVKDLDCEEYEAVLAKERAAKPARVIDGAARKTPCTKCDAGALAQKAKDELAKRRYTAGLEAYDASLRCRPAVSVAREAFTVACENNARAKAKVFWKLLPPATRANAKTACVQNGITVAELDAP